MRKAGPFTLGPRYKNLAHQAVLPGEDGGSVLMSHRQTACAERLCSEIAKLCARDVRTAACVILAGNICAPKLTYVQAEVQKRYCCCVLIPLGTRSLSVRSPDMLEERGLCVCVSQ